MRVEIILWDWNGFGSSGRYYDLSNEVEASHFWRQIQVMLSSGHKFEVRAEVPHACDAIVLRKDGGAK